MSVHRLDSSEPGFRARLEELARFEPPGLEEEVRGIVEAVRARGDEALVELTNRLDGRTVAHAGELEVPPERASQALAGLDPRVRAALETAAERIRAFHEHEARNGGGPWSHGGGDGAVLGQRVVPLERVGVYVPGGRAAYPSSVLMNAIPARVAGVDEVVMAVPAPGGEPDPAVLAAARLAGVDRIWSVGGAQAVAALAWGTRSIPAVDKVVGPGNAFVAAAKRLVFGRVGIDSPAGPSEVLVVADGTAPPVWVAADLCAQAEHDEYARASVVCPDAAYLDAVEAEAGAMAARCERSRIIRASLERAGALVRVRDLDEAVDVANLMAPEHLELSVAEPEPLLERVRHVGAVFLGRYASEVLGDYCAGPNHVLPTGRAARFSSPLGVHDFRKRINVLGCSREAARRLGPVAVALAEAEGLTAHARAAALRMEEEGAAGPAAEVLGSRSEAGAGQPAPAAGRYGE